MRTPHPRPLIDRLEILIALARSGISAAPPMRWGSASLRCPLRMRDMRNRRVVEQLLAEGGTVGRCRRGVAEMTGEAMAGEARR